MKGGSRVRFFSGGYGKVLLAKDSEGKEYAPNTYDYLSRRLYEEFGYVNPNFLARPGGLDMIQSTQYISDKKIKMFKANEIRQFMNIFEQQCG
jgi:hypothetical protein